jgi:hypothetical protein
MSELFESAGYALSLVATNVDTPLTDVTSNRLNLLSRNDANKLLHNAIVTYADAIAGIEHQRYSWAVVKLYYCTFYAVRGILYENGIILIYLNGKPLQIVCSPGERATPPPKSVAGSTHKWAYHTFQTRFPSNPLLSQQIDNLVPFQWMMKQREEVNYKRAMCYEPGCPKIFNKTIGEDVRKQIVQYLDDDTLAFDPDHAILAFPLYVLGYAGKNRRSLNSRVISSGVSKALDKFLADRKGQIQALVALKDSFSSISEEII